VIGRRAAAETPMTRVATWPAEAALFAWPAGVLVACYAPPETRALDELGAADRAWGLMSGGTLRGRAREVRAARPPPALRAGRDRRPRGVGGGRASREPGVWGRLRSQRVRALKDGRRAYWQVAALHAVSSVAHAFCMQVSAQLCCCASAGHCATHELWLALM